jgi:hypothetical protein
VDPDPANAGAISTWCKDYWAVLHRIPPAERTSTSLMDEEQERVQATYRDHLLAKAFSCGALQSYTCARNVILFAGILD